MRSAIKPLQARLQGHFKKADLILILTAFPILVLFTLAPGTFELSWAGFGKLGRGGLFFVLFFLAFELYDFRKNAPIRLNGAHRVAVIILVALATVYFGGVGLGGGFTNFIYSVGKNLGAAGEVSNSWLMATDFLVLTLYILALTVTLFGVRALRSVATPIVFSAGMLVFYSLDAFLPYGSIGPLQFWANFIVAAVGLLSRGFGLPIYGSSNTLTIVGTRGFFKLVVYWPSVGVQSMLIYSLVMVLLAAKLDSPTRRKLIYATVGVAGTVFLNVLRIFLIAYYGYAYATTGQDLDAFHNSIGEILFPIWIVVFLGIVLNVEGRLMDRERGRSMEKPTSPVTSPYGPNPSRPM